MLKFKNFNKNKYYKQLIFCTFVFLLITATTFGQSKGNKKDPREERFNFKFYFLEGEKQKILGNYELALTCFFEANKIKEDATAYYQIASILASGQDFFSATTYAKQAVTIDKTKNVEFIKLLISCQIITKDIKGAIDSYERLIKINDKDIFYYSDLAALYFNEKDYKNAIKTMDRAEKKLGLTEPIALAKEEIYFIQGKKKEAVNEIVKLLKTSPNNNHYKTLLAEAYLNIGDFESAKKWFSEIENVDDLDGYMCLSIANFYQSQKDFDMFFKFVSKVFESNEIRFELKSNILFNFINDPNFSRTYSNQIKVLIDQLILENPDSIEIRAISADYYININDLKSAQQELDILISMDKNKYQIWVQLLSIDYALNDYENLFRHSKEAVELFPNFLEVYKYYIIASFFTKNFQDVIIGVDYASILAINDKDLLLEFLTMQGDAFNALEKYYESDSVFELVLQKNPNNTFVLNNYSYYLALREEKLDRALEMSKKLMQLEIHNPTYIDTHAWVLYKNNEYEKALEEIGRAILYDGKEGIYYNHKGDILLKLNRKEEALKMWEKAKILGDDDAELDNKINSIKNL